MKFKKLMSLMMVSVMAVSAFAACGNTENKETKEESSKVVENSATEQDKEESQEDVAKEANKITFPLEEPIEYTMFTFGDDVHRKSELASWKWFTEEYANIKVEIQDADWNELAEKVNVMINTGDYPDFFMGANFSAAQCSKYGQEGVFIPLEDLIKEHAPNLCAWLDENDGWQYITAEDGHIYSLPEGGELANTAILWINTRWLDNVGMEMPQSYDELYEVLKAFKEQDANGNGDPDDELPLAAANFVNGLPALYAFNEDLITTYPTLVAERADKSGLEATFKHESYKEWLAFCHKLYEEELVNDDCMVASEATVKARNVGGDLVGAVCGMWMHYNGNEEYYEDFVIVKPWNNAYKKNDPIVAGTMVITDKCENPEELIAAFDYFYTKEGTKLSWFGVEGVDYVMENDEVKMLAEKNYQIHRGPGHPQLGFQVDDVNLRASKTNNPFLYHGFTELHEASEYMTAATYYMVSSDKWEEVADAYANLDAYTLEYMANVIVGKVSLEETWDEYVATLDKMNYDRMLEIRSEDYEASKKN